MVRGSASVGFALYPEDAASHDSLLSMADAAMYVVKQSRQSAVAESAPAVPDLPSKICA
jgi:predicted signal transduction protein with EAL and GGDEF domain